MSKKISLFILGILFICSGCTITEQNKGAIPVSAKPKVHVKDIGNVTLPAVADQKYTGSEVKPPATIVIDGKVLVEGVDYKVDYVSNVEVGEATIIITGIGNYRGKKELKFAISNKQSEAVITCNDKVYNGKSQTIAVCSGGSIVNALQINSGTYSINCTGDSEHLDALSKECKIDKADISKLTFESVNEQVKTGKAITPNIVVKQGNINLVENVNYKKEYKNNVNVGTATIIVTGIGDYSGRKEVSFKIVSPKTASLITCENKIYNGNAQIIASCNGGTISNASQTNAGDYVITCKGDNTHLDATEKTCSITKADIAGASVSPVSAVTYTGSEITPTVTVALNGRTLVKNTDYTLSYKNNINAGTATIIVTGKGNYSGTKEISFEISKMNDEITLNPKTASYSGSVVGTSATSKSGLAVTLTYYSDSTCKTKTTTSNAASEGGAPKAAGTYYVIGTTIGNNKYNKATSTCMKAVVINKVAATITCANKTYNGNAQIIATCANGTISNATRTNAGSYTITCKGTGNYSDAPSANCSITKANDTITIAFKSANYSGSAISTSATSKSGLAVTLTYYSDSSCKTKTTTSNAASAGGAPKAAGTYYATGTTAGNTNYNKTTSACTKAVVINKVAAKITCSNKTYNGSSQVIATCANGTISNATQTNAGSYAITCKGDSNHIDAPSVNCSIAKANDTITITTKTANYSGSTISAGATSKSGLAVTLTYYSDSSCKTKTTTSNAASAGGAPKVAGTYYATGTTAGNANYNKTTSACTKAVVINKVAAKITCSNKTYNGSSQVIATCANGTISNATQTNAGSYAITCKGDSNHIDAPSVNCSIAKANDTITITTKTVNYSGSAISTTASAKSGLAVTLTYYSNSSCKTKTTTSNAASAGGAPKVAGTYYATGTIVGNTNYNKTTSACAKAVVINKVAAKITCSNKTYNGSYQTIASCSGGTVGNESKINVGSYTITCKGDGNHTDASNTLCSINSADLSGASVSTIATQTYTGSQITPKPTVTVNGRTLVRDTDYTLSYQNNVKVGTAIITIAGKKNYKGTKTVKFSIIAPTPQYQVTYYGLSFVDTKYGQTVTLSGAEDIPVVSSPQLSLSTNTNYAVSFDYKTNAGTNEFNVDFFPDGLPEIGPVATTTWQHYDWEVSSSDAAFKTAQLRFFDNRGRSSSESDIKITNISLTTYKKETKTSGATLGTLPTSTRPGYTFRGWYTAPSGGTQVSSSTKVTSNMKIYARWELVSVVLPEKFVAPSDFIDTGKNYTSSTLKYKTYKRANTNNYYSLIWVQNANAQINSTNNGLNGGQRYALLNAESRNYPNKGFIGSNGSFTWNSRANIPIIATKGIITQNTKYQTIQNQGIQSLKYATLGVDANGNLISKNVDQSYLVNPGVAGEKLSDAGYSAFESWVRNNGVRNTWAISSFQTGNWRTVSGGADNRTTLCQVDEHNFVLTIEYDNEINIAYELHNLFNCRAVVNLDGGGSSALYYKTNSMSSIGSIRVIEKDNRSIADMLFFAEQ